MANPVTADRSAPSVGSENELMKAIEMAHARADAVYAYGAETLVKEIRSDVWASWDATGENVTVADPEGLNDIDFLDFDCEDMAA